MENLNLFSASSRLKRKCEDSDAVLELLNGVSLSPHPKKLRQDIGSTNYSVVTMDSDHIDPGYINAYTPPDLELREQLPRELQLCPLDIDVVEQLAEPSPSPAMNDEKAIVLYKPVNPPLFPGGPSAGSQLTLRANILTSGVLESSGLLRARNKRDQSWLRIPNSGVKITEIIEEEAAKQQENSRLAVVPWMATTAVMNMPVSQTSIQDLDNMCAETVDIEAMEEDNELSKDFVNSEPGNPNSGFYYEPWQRFGAPQPPSSSVMWSY